MKALSHTEIHKRTRQLGRLDLSRSSFKTLVRSIGEITVGAQMPIQKSQHTEFYFRVRRKTGSKVRKIEELTAPRADLVTGYQRCNAPGDPVFYAATDRLTALKEARAKPGDNIYLSQWIAKKPIPLNIIFAPDYRYRYFNELSPAQTTLCVFFDTLFTRQISPDFSDDYKLTAAIAKRLMNNYDPSPGSDIRADRSVGLRYSSVFSRETNYNVALKAEFANERLQLYHVLQAKVIEIGEDDVPRIEVIDSASVFQGEEVIWSGDSKLLPRSVVSGERRALFAFDNGIWKVPMLEGDITPEVVRAFLCEKFNEG
ncbi:RES domain-containing protein [Phaeobacter inhibens]|uniref:RES domain-containing protein n=1 Tax=Phaeobacter inhibens TaxID=221822 RepID=UPI0021A58566|nr:RES domain-containing protein [Phaeobacter inhibens]UWS06407.1 RES domain-containing protein [Phaeobacter inhibens]